MTHFTDMRVFKQARANLVAVAALTKTCREFGDIRNQIQRSAISVVSNIAEGFGNNSNKQLIKFLGIARGSNHEMLAQLMILSDIGAVRPDKGLIEDINRTGKMLTRLIQYLRKE